MRSATILVAISVAVVLTAQSQTGCLPAEDSATAGVRAPRNTATPPPTTDTGDPTTGDDWPPPLEEEKDFAEITTDGERLELLDGEVTLDIPAGALEIGTLIEITKSVVDVNGVDLVGYIWGPHGMPIDPVARITIKAPTDEIPPWITNPRQARLFVERDGGLTQLPNQDDAKPGDFTVDFSADLSVLGTVVIGPTE